MKEKTGKKDKIKQNGTGKGKKKEVKESHEIQKLINDKTVDGVWKIEVK